MVWKREARVLKLKTSKPVLIFQAQRISAMSSTSLSSTPSVVVPKKGKGRGGKEKEEKEEKKEKEVCSICADYYTAVLRRKVVCKFCSKDACTKCIEHYLLSRPEDAHCIHCRVNYSDAVLAEICTKTYLQQTYYRHRQEVLVNRERANLPALQDEAQRIRRMRERMEKERALEDELAGMKNEHREYIIQHSVLYAKMMEKIKQGQDTKEEKEMLKGMGEKEKVLGQQMVAKRREIREARHMRYVGEDEDEAGQEEKKEDEKRKFIRRCMKTGCQGFLSTAWKCGLCDYYSCSKCFTVRGPEHDSPHTCKKEDLETAELIRSDSKPCPGCGEFINKYTGCFGRDTPILMWDGMVKMSQEIQEGDVLVGDDGQPRTVLGLVNGVEELYEVTQTNGMSYVVNGAHTMVFKCARERELKWCESNKYWTVFWYDRMEDKVRSKRFSARGDVTKEMAYVEGEAFVKTLTFDEVIEMTVHEYLKLPEITRGYMMGFKAEGIHWTRKEVPMDPYVMGLYIGDGINDGMGFAINANYDPEILLYLIKWAESIGCEVVHSDMYAFRIRRRGLKQNIYKAIGRGATSATCHGCKKKKCDLCDLPDVPYEEKEEPQQTLRKNPMVEILASYGLVRGHKSIPMDYILNDRETRLQLLAGIIDTDGHVTKANEGKRVVISTWLEPLAEQIALLSRSLGYVTNIYRIPKKGIVFSKGGEKKDYADHYGINISGQIEEIPTRLPRKKCRNSAPRWDMRTTTLTIKPVGLGEFYGWQVDGNERFLLKDATTVHNCSQVFCVSCHTPWDWDTGKIVTKGPIHNPHYYEWLRRNGGEMPRNPADVPCGGFPNGYELRPLHRCASRHAAQYFFEFHRICMEIQEDTERTYRAHLDERGLRDTHVRFLLGDFDERVWGQRLAQAEKKRKRDAEIQEVFAAFRMVAVELLNRIQHYRDDTVDVFTNLPMTKADAYLETWNSEVQELIQMVNDGLKAISIAHHCSVPYIRVVRSVNDVYIHYRYETQRWLAPTARRGSKTQEASQEATQPQEPIEDEEGEEDGGKEDGGEEDRDQEREEEYILALAIEQSLRNT